MSTKNLALTLIMCITFASADVVAQLDSVSFQSYGIMPKQNTSISKNIQINGFYRFFGTYQRQLDPYLLNPIIGDTALPRNIFIGDDSQLPNLLINVAGKTSDKTNWGFDIMMFQFLNGALGSAYSGQVTDSLRPNIQTPLLSTRLGGNMGLNLGINLNGNFKTKVGNISVGVGGIQWFAMSDLTMASFKGYNRFMLYERNPWDPMGKNLSGRYQQYFEQGSISQDTRWGNRAFIGALVQGTKMPANTSFALLVGKTELNGGFSQVPNMSFGGKFRKDFGAKKFISLNSINSRAATDSLSRDFYGFYMATIEAGCEFNGFEAKAEIGGGNYYSPVNNAGWGEAVQVKVASPAISNKPQIELHYYRISPDVVNNNAVFWNTSTPEYRTNNIPAGSVGSSAVLQPFSSSMIRLGQMTNNRQGLHLNFQTSKGKLRFSGGLGFAAELTPSATVITYGHSVNQLTRSRFWRWNFPTGVGPYGRYSDVYRDMYETVNLSDDSSGVSVHQKHFNMMEGQFKYHTTWREKDLFIFALLQANSVSRTWSPVTITNEKAYVRQYISEFELYYAITPGCMLNAYYGYERTLANYLTDIDEISRRPRNQTGEGIGCGFDLDFGKNVRLYARHRWYYFKDQSFDLDHFRGRELTIELKAFF
ncbi:MAG: hypothetical protein ACKVOK_01525 [Flavobacteriales bacterium]